MDIKQLQQFYAFRQLGKGVSRVPSDPTVLVMIVQTFPFVAREDLRNMKLGLISTGSSYEDILREKTVKHSRIDRQKSLEKTFEMVEAYRENPPAQYTFKVDPIHYTLKAVATREPLDKLGLTPRGIHFIASLMTEQLTLACIDPFLFVSSCLDQSGKASHFADIILCRKLFFDAIQHHRIDCVVLNEHLFAEQARKLREQEELEKTTQQFSSYINCRKCFKYTVTLVSRQGTLGQDEISTFQSHCHSCNFRFICKG